MLCPSRPPKAPCLTSARDLRPLSSLAYTRTRPRRLFLAADVPRLLTRLDAAASLDAALDHAGSTHVVILEMVPDQLRSKREAMRTIVQACTRRGLDLTKLLICSSSVTVNLDEVVNALPIGFGTRVVALRFYDPCYFVDKVARLSTPRAPPFLHALRVRK